MATQKISNHTFYLSDNASEKTLVTVTEDMVGERSKFNTAGLPASVSFSTNRFQKIALRPLLASSQRPRRVRASPH